VPAEEVRFAVVLNGGVSLAVWMGGVVLELDRLTKADPAAAGPYALLKRLTGCTARADVITGTSAGGINGAALALTQVNRHKDPAMLRDLWIDQGRIESLLRQPFRGQPTSLLRGDEYFLPRLHAALEMLSASATDPPGTCASPREAPIDLSITTTVLRGNEAVSVDSTGQQLPQSLHAARFHWERRPDVTDAADPFAQHHQRRTAHRLALAARSSASFPVAFEPSFVPVGSPDHREPGPGETLTAETTLRPDMADLVRGWGTSRTGDRSRFCVDGGVLANTPTLAALSACEAMPAAGPVRRLMLLVFPHAPEPGLQHPDDLAKPPTVAGAVSGLLGALTAQGGRSYVESLERHNLAAAGRRGARGDILRVIAGDPQPGPAQLQELVAAIYPQYKRLRRWRAGRDLAAWRTGMVDDEFAVSDLPPEWNFDRVRSAAERAQDAWEQGTGQRPGRPVPYYPTLPPATTRVGERGWGWGISPALGVAEAVNDLLRRLVWVLPPGPSYDAVESARTDVLQLADLIRAARGRTDDYWQHDPVLLGLPPNQSYWTLRLACYDHLMRGTVSLAEIDAEVTALAGVDDERRAAVRDALTAVLQPHDRPAPGHVGGYVRALVRRVVLRLQPVLGVLKDEMATVEALDPDLANWRTVLFPGDDPAATEVDVLLTRLLQLEVASTTLGDEVRSGATLPVELVQVSARTDNAFAQVSRTPADKLGGDAVNRFGGFLKRSWRVNDWIWGRVDGATILSRTMLDPRRIRRAARVSGFLGDLATAAGQPGAVEARLRAEATVDEVVEALDLDLAEVATERQLAVDELAEVFSPDVADGDLPSALPHLGALFAWGLHLGSVAEELPVLAQAIAADRVDGANPRSRGELFLAERAELLRRLDQGRHDPAGVSRADRREALTAFDRAGLGSEPMEQEAGSDLVIRTAASTAAVAATVVDSQRSGLAAAKPVTRAFRGTMLLPYWAIWGLSSRQTIARGLALLALALGGTALALALFGVLSPNLQPIAAALGAGALLAAFSYGALRTGSLLHGVVLLTPLIPLAVFATTTGRADTKGVSTVVIVAALALGLIALGSIGVASGSVWAALDRLGDRQRIGRPRRPDATGRGTALYALKVWLRRLGSVGLGALKLALLVLVVLGLAWLVHWLIDPARLEFVQANHRWLWAPALAVAVLGGLAAHWESKWFGVLTSRSDGVSRRWEYAPVVDPHATAAGWSVVYGAVYLAVAWVVSLEVLGADNPLWRRVAFATAVVFAVLLLLAVPVLLPLAGIRTLGRREVLRAVTTAPPPGADPAKRQRAFAEDLCARGVSYRRYVGYRGEAVRLTGSGESLEKRVRNARAGVELEQAWNAPERCSQADVERLRTVLAGWEQGAGATISAPARARVDTLRDLVAERPEGATPPDPARVRSAADRLLRSLGRVTPR
jgi:patatin-related protein